MRKKKKKKLKCVRVCMWPSVRLLQDLYVPFVKSCGTNEQISYDTYMYYRIYIYIKYGFTQKAVKTKDEICRRR